MVKVGNFGDMSMADYQAANQIWLDLCLVDPRMQIGGVCVMIDFSGIKKEAMKQLFDPKLSKAGTRYTQECLPFRVNKLIYYNMPKIFESLFNFYAEWMNEKMRSRIVALSDDLTPAFEAVPGLKDLVENERSPDGELHNVESNDAWNCIVKHGVDFQVFKYVAGSLC
ncbi:hypothetical protein Aperf_G00000035268 [Anoplocephala perfoliata]